MIGFLIATATTVVVAYLIFHRYHPQTVLIFFRSIYAALRYSTVNETIDG